MDDDRSKKLKEKGNAKANVNGNVSSASGSGLSSRTSTSRGSRGGKGKEREREPGDSVHDASGGGAVGEAEDGSTESVLPMYVYDAMKVKRRFEHMRVSFFVLCSPVISSFLPFSFLSFSFNVIPSHPIS